MILQCRPKVPLVRLVHFSGQQHLHKVQGAARQPLDFIILYLCQAGLTALHPLMSIHCHINLRQVIDPHADN